MPCNNRRIKIRSFVIKYEDEKNFFSLSFHWLYHSYEILSFSTIFARHFTNGSPGMISPFIVNRRYTQFWALDSREWKLLCSFRSFDFFRFHLLISLLRQRVRLSLFRSLLSRITAFSFCSRIQLHQL